MERIMIHLENVDPDEIFVQGIKAELGFAIEGAPSDASLCCCIIKEDDGYSLNMKIHSVSGHFFIQSAAVDIEELIEITTDQMKKQFKLWHKDPAAFRKTHPYSKQPCTDRHGKVINCPLDKSLTDNFEDEYRL